MGVESRSSRLELVRAKGDGTFTARAVRYGGPPDEYGSVWAAGVFNDGLAQRLPVIAFAHSWSEPIGRATGWQDRADGLYIDARLDVHPDVPKARQVYAQLQSGTLTDVSVGFSVPPGGRRPPTQDEAAQWPAASEVITRADLDELSVVLRGAVQGAEVTAVRAGRTPEARHLAVLLADGVISADEYLRRMDEQRHHDDDLEREALEALEIVRRRLATPAPRGPSAAFRPLGGRR